MGKDMRQATYKTLKQWETDLLKATDACDVQEIANVLERFPRKLNTARLNTRWLNPLVRRIRSGTDDLMLVHLSGKLRDVYLKTFSEKDPNLKTQAQPTLQAWQAVVLAVMRVGLNAPNTANTVIMGGPALSVVQQDLRNVYIQDMQRHVNQLVELEQFGLASQFVQTINDRPWAALLWPKGCTLHRNAVADRALGPTEAIILQLIGSLWDNTQHEMLDPLDRWVRIDPEILKCTALIVQDDALMGQLYEGGSKQEMKKMLKQLESFMGGNVFGSGVLGSIFGNASNSTFEDYKDLDNHPHKYTTLGLPFVQAYIDKQAILTAVGSTGGSAKPKVM